VNRALAIGSWVTIGADCPLSCQALEDDDLVSFVCGTSPWDFEFSMAGDALRTFVRLGTEALAKLDGQTPQAHLLGR
jgi:hypothetical protein